MKPTEVLTAIIAVYAAILSTINLLVAIRAKRWHVAVTHSIGALAGPGGKKVIMYRAINLGERDVALKGFSIEFARANKGIFRHIRKVLTIVRTLSRVEIDGMFTGMFTEEFVVKCEPTLPLALNPGRACEMTVDQGQLLESLEKMFGNSVAGVRGVFEDETGRRIYRSPPASVDWQRREIDFP